MKNLILMISDIGRLNLISESLARETFLSKDDQIYLLKVLDQIPTVESVLAKSVQIEEPFAYVLWDMKKLEDSLKDWKVLFNNIPGYDYVGCYTTGEGEKKFLKKGIIMTVDFCPTYAYNMAHNEGYEIYLKDDGSARFRLPKLRDVNQYPALYHFNGTWKEAYLLLIETLKKGWPMEEFPEELKPLLKK